MAVAVSAVRRIVLGGAALLGTVAAAPAQGVVATLDAGAAGVRYADSLGITAATLSPVLSLQSGAGTLTAAGTFARDDHGAWSMQGELTGSAFTRAVGSVRGELTGSVGGSAHQDGTRTSEILARGRVHLMRRVWGAWVGGGGGRTWDGDVWRGVALGDFGIWRRAGRATVLLTAAPAMVDDTLRYTDAELAGRWVTPRIELGGVLGARAGQGLPSIAGSAKTWGSVSATVWVSPLIGLVASAGSYPVDFTQGYPGGRFITAGIRMAIHGPTRGVTGAVGAPYRGETRPATVRRPPSGISGFEVRKVRGDRRTFRVRAPNARRVEIAGDFTNWDAVPLAHAADGWWWVTLPISAGTHQLNVRLDGMAWVVPSTLTTITDESGTSGLLVVTP